ncbi:recombinase family protein [Peptoniphilus sp. KCTC 25270]|uniref:recombinase family protein n=1 Tax=Peptoniphilus sp. KCTC 25270 TaxID=2897414 RepID=UPI001E577437|nr:recombinase family protein [Peptoniphilus sp. KCTC 25270]MCD1146891.1 recombinase family protein [Peptoniphilus sp. KCTC 25270]
MNNNYTYAYVRVSSKEQNTDRQVEAIKEYCKQNQIELEERNIIIDKASGKDFNRENYSVLRNSLLRKGDTLIIKELDRLGRNKTEIKKELEYFKEQEIRVKILNIPTTLIEFTGEQSPQWILEMINNILIEVLGAISEEERLKIRQRQREGIEIAKANGKHLGRPKMNFESLTEKQQNLIHEYYPRWQNKEITATDFMKLVELKRGTFYKIMNEYKERM